MARAVVQSLEARRLLALPALSVDAGERRLIDDSSEPVFFQGDTAWSILTGATFEDAEAYLTDRASRGVNVIVVNLIEALFNGPVNQYGEGPFLTEGDFATPNEAYFEHADRVLRRAEDLGIYILLAPAYLGFPDTNSGWYDAVLESGTETMFGYGVFVGNRYRAFSNIIWMPGGDRNPDLATEETNAMVAGIKSTGDTHLFTAHALPDFSAADAYGQPWLDISNVYTYSPAYTRMQIEYGAPQTRPAFLLEDRYEGMGSTALLRRANKYWSILSGGFGAIMGNDPIWRMGTGWQNEFDSPLARDMTVLGNFFRSINWDHLQPAQQLVIAGQAALGSDDYITAALADDRRQLIAYAAAGRSFQLDLNSLAGPLTARWFDPTNGTYTPINGVEWSNASWVPPGLNAGGETDWLLVIDASDAAPFVNWINFEVDRPAPSITAQFSEYVGGTLEATDFEIVSLVTGQRIDPTLTRLVYDQNTQRSALELPASLPAGNYTVRLISSGVADRDDTALPLDVGYAFSYLPGDANRDRMVGFADLVTLVRNYGRSGKTFSEGNFDYSPDGQVGFSDLLILARNFNTSLPVDSPTRPSSSPIISSRQPARVATSVFRSLSDQETEGELGSR